MRQNAKIVALLPDGDAVASIKRATACGHDCTSCGACGAQAKPIEVNVANPIGAQVGDQVEIETKTSRVLSLAVVVYIMPLILLFAFYAAFDCLWKSEALSIIGAALGLVAGVLLCRILNRHESKKKSSGTVVRVIG